MKSIVDRSDRNGCIPVVRNLVLITGFRQQHGRAATGIDELWWKLHSDLAGPGTVVWLRAWNDDFRALAEQMEHYRAGGQAEVIVVAYSWGVGHGAVELARELSRFGISVQTLYSIDGVYRSACLLWR